ncbi:MAG: DUF6428 family protein [Pseudomonadota bacterium]
MTFEELLEHMRGLPENSELIFKTDTAQIQGGYHITELRNSEATSIDCGGQTSTFTKGHLQLLDGYGGDHMTVRAFRSILETSLQNLPQLGGADILVEFSPGNNGLALWAPGVPTVSGAHVEMRLRPVGAVCKPFERQRTSAAEAIGCCVEETATTSCCG